MRIRSINKDTKKIIRTIIEVVILIVLGGILVKTLLVFDTYKPYDPSDKTIVTGKDHGFIGISYAAVDREGTSSMISLDRLEEHIKALQKNGYVTITQDDIINYYHSGRALPDKSLYLMFEDGRTDTAVFAQEILEKYNYKGTIFGYVEKFDNRDTQFLMPKDLKSLENSTFWELGTNGYRLSYINVFDRDGNHYLMDYIRDENGIPKETYDEMRSRISTDYKLMDEVYTNKLGKLPDAYCLMHSNTGKFATNEKVSQINEEWLKKLFKLNFNREGSPFNNREDNIYDLTRLQPQPYWYPNHLLMRISEATKETVDFEQGDLSQKADWEVLKGAPEFRNSVIALTSVPQGNGLIRLKNSKDYQDLKLSVTLTGNKLGTQTIYLRADENLKQYVSIKIQNNFIYLIENGKELFKLDLDPRQSPLQLNEAGNRLVDIDLRGDRITVMIDKKKVISDWPLSHISAGYVYLESAWGGAGYSQRNLADDVYDGVFEDLLITASENPDLALYNARLSGWASLEKKIVTTWQKTIDWFIYNL